MSKVAALPRRLQGGGRALAFLALLATAAHAADIEKVVVHAERRPSGGGLIAHQDAPLSVSTVAAAYIHTQAAIQNAYQYVALAPGAAVATSDPYGLSESFTINVRGLGQDELGYVLDGMPLNDIGYYVAYPSQFIDSENIATISLQQGAADLDSPVISAAGGLLTIATIDPALKPGGTADASYGSYHANREFIRLDSGLIADTGVRAFISYSHTAADNYRGSGRDHRQHIDYKLVREWGAGNRIALTGTYHDGITSGYPQPTLDQFHQDHRSNNYDGTYTPGDGNFWGLNQGTFRVLYMSAPSHFILSHALAVDVTPYWQYGYGNSPYGTTLTEDGNDQGTEGPYSVAIPNAIDGTGTVEANYTDLQYRAGVVAKLTYTTGHNTLIAGAWYDYADETDRQSFAAVSAQGFPADIWQDTGRGLIRLPDGRPLLAGADHVITQVVEAFAADRLQLLDNRLTIEAGFKQAIVARDGVNQLPGPQYRADVNDLVPLPRVSARYQVDPAQQLFISATTNFRTASEATLFDTYAGTDIASAANTKLKPEYSISEELGYRYAGPLLTASATVFNYNFTNRQVATIVGGNMINESINAGGQTSRGIDLEAGTRPWHDLSPYVSFEYLHATIDNDLQVGPDTLPTAGKTAVRSPRTQAGIGLAFDNGTLFANLGVKYVGSQFSTFTNDEKIPAYATADLGLGYRLPRPPGLRARPELKLNIINLTDSDHLSGVYNPTANAHDTTGRGGTTIAGNAPTYLIAGGIAVMITAQQDF